jgi:UDP-N-acetylmuramate-alanine ligase
MLRPGDLLVVLGAGDITKVAEEVLHRLRARGAGLRVV